MFLLVYIPVVVSVFLLPWCEVSMCFIVHFGDFRPFFLVTVNGVEHLLGAFTANGGHSEDEAT